MKRILSLLLEGLRTLGIVTTVLVLAMVCIFLFNFNPKNHTCGEPNRSVDEIGACDSAGHCQVKFNDDSYGLVDYPAIGKTYTGCEVNNDPHN